MSVEIVKASEFGLEESKAENVAASFAPLIAERDVLTKVYENIITKELSAETSEEARVLFNRFGKVGTGVDKTHKNEKAFVLSYGRYVDAWKNSIKGPMTLMKDNLKPIIKYQEIQEGIAQAKLKTERENELIKYVTEFPMGLEVMDESIYQTLKKGFILTWEEKQAADKKLEEDRILAEKARKEEDERVRKENDKLKAEAEVAEKKRLEEDKKRKEVETKRLQEEAKERAKIEEKTRIERAKQEAILEKERQEKKKLEDELKAKQDAELKVIADREAKEKVDAEAQRKANLAPEKDKIAAWIEGMTIPNIVIEGFSKEGVDVCNEVIEKFEAFKQWSLTQKDSIK